MPARETASCGTTRAPSPCLPSSCASIADAASSSGPRPAMQRTGASRPPQRRAALVRAVAGVRRRLLRQRPFGLRRRHRRRRPPLPGAGSASSWSASSADQLLDRVLDPLELLRREHAALRVVGGELQALERHLVVVGGERALLQQQLGVVLHLVRVAGEHALVEALDRRQRRPVAQQHVEELQPLHVPAQHHQAEGQRRRQDQPDRAPQPAPEDRRDHHREGRQAGAVAVDQRLDHLAHDRLGDRNRRRRPDHHGPARIDGGGQRHGQGAGDERADIGHEAQQRREHAPEHRAAARRSRTGRCR